MLSARNHALAIVTDAASSVDWKGALAVGAREAMGAAGQVIWMPMLSNAGSNGSTDQSMGQ